MFVLRKIKESGEISNSILGKNYSRVTRWNDREQFNTCCEKHYGEKSDSECVYNVYGFIIDDTANTIALIKKEKNYIMISNGETFENISYNKLDSDDNNSDEKTKKINEILNYDYHDLLPIETGTMDVILVNKQQWNMLKNYFDYDEKHAKLFIDNTNTVYISKQNIMFVKQS
jgi:hypothetical protein